MRWKPLVLVLVAWAVAAGLRAADSVLKAKPSPKTVPIAWQTDYRTAMEEAEQRHKMLLVFFHDEADAACRRFEKESLGDTAVREKLQQYVCVRLPRDAKISREGKPRELLEDPAFEEMLHRPGIVIIDTRGADQRLSGMIVSEFPLTEKFFYTAEQMQVILDLPAGTLTQRTLIYAVRTHAEKPCSALGQPDGRLLAEAEDHSQHQARLCLQGHHRWESRFVRISGLLGYTAREVCAESWPGQHLLEAAVECVRCWHCSHGHWSAVAARNQAFGYDMKRGSNGVWYATGIFGMR